MNGNNISRRLRNKYQFPQSLFKIQNGDNKRNEYMREELGTADRPDRYKKGGLSKEMVIVTGKIAEDRYKEDVTGHETRTS
jgi:hypothetical protein